jgi:hypothetical protein
MLALRPVRREARRQFRVIRQLMAAGNEDDVLDLISSIEEANGPLSPLTG